MAETSQFWNTTGTGDGPSGGYTMADWNTFFSNIMLSAAGATGAVLEGVGSELACTGAATPIAVAAGAAIVYGYMYNNSASVNLAVTTPVVGTTGGHVILRASWAAQTVRLVAVRNTDGLSAIPALTQTAGVTYEIRLASFTITTGGVIALTDARTFNSVATQVSTAMLIDAAVTTAKITDANVTSAKLASAAVIAGKIAAGGVSASNQFAASVVDATALASNAVTTVKIIDDAVTVAKIGTMVLGFTGRQAEGSGSSWSGAGSTNFTAAVNTRMQCGAFTYGAGGVVTFPVAFSKPPVVVAVALSSSAVFVTVVGSTTTTFTYKGWDDAGAVAAPNCIWIAIGEE